MSTYEYDGKTYDLEKSNAYYDAVKIINEKLKVKTPKGEWKKFLDNIQKRFADETLVEIRQNGVVLTKETGFHIYSFSSEYFYYMPDVSKEWLEKS